MNGKGSKPRPRQVDYKEYEKNWQLIFGKKNENTRSNKNS